MTCTRQDTTSFSVHPASSQQRGHVLDRLSRLRSDVRSELAGLRVESALSGEKDPAVDDEPGRVRAGRLRPDDRALSRHSDKPKARRVFLASGCAGNGDIASCLMGVRAKHIGARVFAALRPSPRVPTMPWSAQRLELVARRRRRWHAPPAASCSSGSAKARSSRQASATRRGRCSRKASRAGRRSTSAARRSSSASSSCSAGSRCASGPGLGTVGNVIVIGLALDVASRVLPQPAALAVAVAPGRCRHRHDCARERVVPHREPRPRSARRLDDRDPPAHGDRHRDGAYDDRVCSRSPSASCSAAMPASAPSPSRFSSATCSRRSSA